MMDGDAASPAVGASSAAVDAPQLPNESPTAGAPPSGDAAPAEEGNRQRRKRGRRRAPKLTGPGQSRGRGMAHLLPQSRFPAVGRGGGIHPDLIDRQFPVVGRGGEWLPPTTNKAGRDKEGSLPARDQARAKRSKQTCPVG